MLPRAIDRWWYNRLEEVELIQPGERRGAGMHRGRHTVATEILRETGNLARRAGAARPLVPRNDPPLLRRLRHPRPRGRHPCRPRRQPPGQGRRVSVIQLSLNHAGLRAWRHESIVRCLQQPCNDAKTSGGRVDGLSLADSFRCYRHKAAKPYSPAYGGVWRDLARRRSSWLGVTRRGSLRHDRAGRGQGRAWRGQARPGAARAGPAGLPYSRLGRTRQGKAGQGRAVHGMAQLGAVRCGRAWPGSPTPGMTGPGEAGPGLARQGLAWRGMAWLFTQSSPASVGTQTERKEP